MANEIQQIEFSATPVSGNWTITFDGQTTSNISYITTPNSILETLSNIGIGNVSVSGTAQSGLVTVEFQGTLANTNVPQMTADASGLLRSASTINVAVSQYGSSGTQEVQTITVTADGGTWQINGGSALQYNATNLDVETAIENATGQGVSVSGGNGSPCVVTWDSPGNRDLLTVTSIDLTNGGGGGSVDCQETTPGVSGVVEIQTITLADSPTGGTWQINAVGDNMAYNVSAANLETNLESILSTGVAVSGSDGGPYTVTWDSVGSRSLLSANGDNLTKGGITATVNTTQQGSAAAIGHSGLLILGAG